MRTRLMFQFNSTRLSLLSIKVTQANSDVLTLGNVMQISTQSESTQKAILAQHKAEVMIYQSAERAF